MSTCQVTTAGKRLENFFYFFFSNLFYFGATRMRMIYRPRCAANCRLEYDRARRSVHRWRWRWLLGRWSFREGNTASRTWNQRKKKDERCNNIKKERRRRRKRGEEKAAGKNVICCHTDSSIRDWDHFHFLCQAEIERQLDEIGDGRQSSSFVLTHVPPLFLFERSLIV